MPPNPDQGHLRAIARQVGDLIRTCPPLAARLQKAWEDYRVLHVKHVEERRKCEWRQREFAIGILKQGFLWEHPRREYEPNWDWEPFRVRLPSDLVRKWKAEKVPAKQKQWNARIAAATLRFVKVQEKLLACQGDPEKHRKLWERIDANMPLGKYEAITIRVGFRPQRSFTPSPHPLFCSWKEYQKLPVGVRETVAFATLAVLHDDLSASPVLVPLPSTLGSDPAQARETIVSWAVRECLRVTEAADGDSGPPQPNPRRLPVEKAEAFFALLRAEAKRLPPPISGKSALALSFPDVGGGPALESPAPMLEAAVVLVETPPEAPKGLLPCLRALAIAFSIDGRSVAWLASDVLSRRLKQGEQNIRQASSPDPRMSRPRWEAAERQFGADSAQQLAGMANPPIPESAMERYRPIFQWGIDVLDGTLAALVDGEGDALDHAAGGRETVATLAADLTGMRRTLARLSADLGKPVQFDMEPVQKMVGLRERLESVADMLEFAAKKALKADDKGKGKARTPQGPTEVTAEHRPASWIAQTTHQGITCEALRKAVKGERLRQSVKQGEWLHYVPEVAKVWPAHSGELHDALVENATFVKPKSSPNPRLPTTTKSPGPNRPKPA